MTQWPYINYIKNGEQVTIKMPDSLDVFDFLVWMDTKFMGMDPAVIEQRRADEAVQARQPVRRKRK